MADGRLDNLLAALREVAANQPDADDNDSDWNEDDPADDNDDPNNDSRSYYPDQADTKDSEDEDQTSDFRMRKPLGTVMLLQKLENEAEARLMTELEAENQAIVQRMAKLPPTKQEQDRKRLAQLKLKTAQIQDELELDRKLKLEEKLYVEARMLQRKANLTVAEKKAEAESVRQGQISFSRVCPEAHPDWRQQAAEAWRSKSCK